jgi:hypothetical protein
MSNGDCDKERIRWANSIAVGLDYPLPKGTRDSPDEISGLSCQIYCQKALSI